MEEKADSECLQDWFEITIPNGIKYDKIWLMDSLQTYCRVTFTPVEFHYIKYEARFYIQDANVAAALKDNNCKICDEENKKISIFVTPSPQPQSFQTRLKPEEIEQLKLTMYKRYDSSQQCLDLQSLCFDPDLENYDVDIILNESNCMATIVQIIEQNFPELLSLNLQDNELYQLDGLSDIMQLVPTVKILNLSRNELGSVEEVRKMKGLKLQELWLYGNPLCDAFPDQSAYMSAIRACFPTLLRLDGQKLPPVTDSDVPEIIKPCKESYQGSETLKNLVLQFLLQYYLIYDYGDRQDLLSVYHEEACFSLTVPFSSEDPALSSLGEYLNYSRNMKTLEDPDLRVQLLKNTKYDIVESLCMLPRTQHDLNTYVVEMCVQTETMVYFSVNGVFKEVEGKSHGSVRTFTRTFILTPGTNSGLYIVNDEMTLRTIGTQETQNTDVMPGPNCCPVLSVGQQEMVQAFSSQSGMNFHWSQKCLQDNGWNYSGASHIFSLLKNEGKIPEEAFQQTP
ncbi:PREDICTED: nuclear RNA export factor 2 [Condylura cristata]|uniref:nuclear RNA export factor 2 n=1 Tax=Condylura cristata TaxID=143302 RepID=UPI0003347100|nr:PREDICTED: nuclear RNA export factor 2 [Condylura cristata]